MARGRNTELLIPQNPSFGGNVAVGGTLTVTGTSTFSSDIKIDTVGFGLYLKQGTNATFGTVTLSSGGTALLYSTKLTANSQIFTANKQGGTSGAITFGTLSSGAVQLKSTSTTDTGVIGYLIVEPS